MTDRYAMRRWRASRPTLPPGDPRHGTNCYSNYGCRCPIGRAAEAARIKAWRERKRLELIEEMERAC